MIELITLIITGIGLAVTVGASYESKYLGDFGSYLRTRITSVANDLAKKMSDNSSLLEKVTLAYQNRNTQLLSQLFTGMGFGARMKSILSALQNNEEEYQKESERLKKLNSEIELQINELNTASSNAGVSHQGNKLARETLAKYDEETAREIQKEKEDKIKQEEDLRNFRGGHGLVQNVLGGMNEGKAQQALKGTK